MKKLIAMLLALTFSFALFAPAGAASPSPPPSTSDTEDQAYARTLDTLSKSGWTMKSIGHGEFVLNDSFSPFSNNSVANSASATAGNLVQVEATQDTEIFKVSDGRYLVQATENSYLLTDKISLDVSNLDRYDSLFAQYNLSPESIDNIRKVASTQQSIGNTDFSIELYVPSELDDLNSSSLVERVAQKPVTSYYTYTDSSGYVWKMRDVSQKFSKLRLKDSIKKSGVNTKNTAKACTGLILSIGGSITKIAKFATAASVATSLYDFYSAARGEVMTCTSSDYISSMLTFERIEKETSVLTSAGSYQYGKLSHKVWLNRLDCYQLYTSDNMTPHFQPISINQSFYSRYWSDDSKTLARIGGEDYLTCTIYGVKVILNGE